MTSNSNESSVNSREETPLPESAPPPFALSAEGYLALQLGLARDNYKIGVQNCGAFPEEEE